MRSLMDAWEQYAADKNLDAPTLDNAIPRPSSTFIVYL